jgi:hypothetical protein
MEFVDTKFHGNLSVRDALIHGDRWAGGGADMQKLTGAFRDCSNAPKKDSFDTEPSHIV